MAPTTSPKPAASPLSPPTD
ncbi:hypothetical protein NJB1907E78_22300, partial [Mycobacterium marinum]